MPLQTHTLSFTFLGEDLENFTVISDLGPVSPSVVSRETLLNGFTFSADLWATTITIKSTGFCDEDITVMLPNLRGCTDSLAVNYNPNANENDGSCIPRVFGCTNPDAVNYDSLANTDNGSCYFGTPGCTNLLAKNFSPFATFDDGSCEFPVCDFGSNNVVLDETTLIVDNFTEINIYFDSSGSMNSTLPPLNDMRDNYLKACLLPFYNGNETLYNDRVKLFSFANERTFSLNTLGTPGSSPEVTKVINFVFQDEAQSVYHLSNLTFDPFVDTPTTSFINDIDNLKAMYSAQPHSYYRGVVFQVQGYPVYKTFLEAVESGTGNFNIHNTSSISSQISYNYDVIAANSDAKYYANLITGSLNQLGYNVPTC
jgi:hypothetical protein